MSPAPTTPWLSERDLRDGSATRLFCLPHAGSGAAGFHRWKRSLPQLAVCPVLLPGREARLSEPALEYAEALIDGLMQASAPHMDRRYAIFGHSMGALLAWMWAGRIQAAGLQAPACLFVSGRNAPHLPFAHRDLHRLEDTEFLSGLQRLYGGDQEELLTNEELREVFLPILRADLKVVETYRHQALVVACPIVALAGIDDLSVTDEGLAAWASLTSRDFSLARLPGDHFYHLGEGQTRLLETIADHLG